MPLRGAPLSPSSVLLVDLLVRDVLTPTGAFSDRPSSALKARKALGALLSDLFDFQAGKGSTDAKRPVLGAHRMSMSDFPAKQLGFGYTSFVAVVKALHGAEMLEVFPGWSRRQTLFDNTHYGKGRVTRFRLTGRLIELAGGVGVTVADWKAHWGHAIHPRVHVPSSVPRLVLKEKKVRCGPHKESASIPIDFSDPVAAKLLADVEALNDYLAKQSFTGIAFAGLRRVFNNGDQPGFAWRTGGRYTSLPGGCRYENLPAADRSDRIVINGEAVGEVDITASHLSFIYAICGQPFDPAATDPYHLSNHPDLPREIVKAWITQALGLGSPFSNRWSDDARRRYKRIKPDGVLRDDIPIASVRSAVLDRHPILEELDRTGLNTLDLQYHETEVLRLALEDLRDQWDIPALPMHDGLIAPLPCLARAASSLEEAFATYMGLEMGYPTTVRLAVTRKVLREP